MHGWKGEHSKGKRLSFHPRAVEGLSAVSTHDSCSPVVTEIQSWTVYTCMVVLQVLEVETDLNPWLGLFSLLFHVLVPCRFPLCGC